MRPPILCDVAVRHAYARAQTQTLLPDHARYLYYCNVYSYSDNSTRTVCSAISVHTSTFIIRSYSYDTRYCIIMTSNVILGNSQDRGLPVRLPWESPSPEVGKWACHIRNKTQFRVLRVKRFSKCGTRVHGGASAATASGRWHRRPSRKITAAELRPSRSPARRRRALNDLDIARRQPGGARTRARWNCRQLAALRSRLALIGPSRQPCAAGFLELAMRSEGWQSEMWVGSTQAGCRSERQPA